MNIKNLVDRSPKITTKTVLVYDRCLDAHADLNLPCFSCSSAKRTDCLRVFTARKKHQPDPVEA
jgi:hypothetical protein